MFYLDQLQLTEFILWERKKNRIYALLIALFKGRIHSPVHML